MPISLCYFETLYQTLKLLGYRSVIYRSPGTAEIWTVPENSECQLPIPPALVTGETAEKPQARPSVECTFQSGRIARCEQIPVIFSRTKFLPWS